MQTERDQLIFRKRLQQYVDGDLTPGTIHPVEDTPERNNTIKIKYDNDETPLGAETAAVLTGSGIFIGIPAIYGASALTNIIFDIGSLFQAFMIVAGAGFGIFATLVAATAVYLITHKDDPNVANMVEREAPNFADLIGVDVKSETDKPILHDDTLTELKTLYLDPEKNSLHYAYTLINTELSSVETLHLDIPPTFIHENDVKGEQHDAILLYDKDNLPSNIAVTDIVTSIIDIIQHKKDESVRQHLDVFYKNTPVIKDSPLYLSLDDHNKNYIGPQLAEHNSQLKVLAQQNAEIIKTAVERQDITKQ